MILVQATGISGGVAAGKLQWFQRRTIVIPPQGSGGPDAEKARLLQARAHAVGQLEQLSGQCRSVGSEDAAALFEAHAALVEDEDLTADLLTALNDEGIRAEDALSSVGAQYAALFERSEDPVLRARASDLQDVTRRILLALSGEEADAPVLTTPVILAADDLTPSEAIRLDRTKVLGLLLREGTHNGHTALLARTLGIPAVCQIGDALDPSLNGHSICMNGETGQIVIDPDETTQAAFLSAERERADQTAALRCLIGTDDVSPCGQPLPILCNISSPDDVSAVLVNDGRGIGLYRSEFLFLDRSSAPSEEEQFAAYRAVLSAMDGKPVTIRTLDIGADKQVSYLPIESGPNPALGLRGTRLCLAHPDLFRKQLRALYRASVYGELSILLPMISSITEIQACKQACKQVMEELSAQGIPFERGLKIGVMIETPAAVFLADELAKQVDFFSVGTNDLTQYILACDRQSQSSESYFDPRHPALLRALKHTADNAHAAGIPVGICGELAADPAMLPFFLELRIDALSVPPASVLPLRAKLRDLC